MGARGRRKEQRNAGTGIRETWAVLYVFGAILIGFVAAVLAGMFGIGGAGITTPAIRVFLDAPPAIALGTTLPVTIPTAASGALTYLRRGLVDRRVAGFCCLSGLAGAVGGALLTEVIDLHYLMLLTGAVVLYTAGVTIRRGLTGRGAEPDPEAALPSEHPGAPLSVETEPVVEEPHPALLLLGIGLVAGLFSGLLGVGGGIVLIPSFLYILHMPLKKTFGTSLSVITVIAIPGTIVHAFLHHISWSLVLYLVIGSIPGAYLGARFSIRTGERSLYLLFGLLLAVFGVVFIVNEIISMVH
jgi:uncharacterized membrane protein YfcA